MYTYIGMKLHCSVKSFEKIAFNHGFTYKLTMNAITFKRSNVIKSANEPSILTWL